MNEVSLELTLLKDSTNANYPEAGSPRERSEIKRKAKCQRKGVEKISEGPKA